MMRRDEDERREGNCRYTTAGDTGSLPPAHVDTCYLELEQSHAIKLLREFGEAVAGRPAGKLERDLR